MNRVDRSFLLELVQVYLLGIFAPLGLVVLSLPNLFRRLQTDVLGWSLFWIVPVVLVLGAETARLDLAGFASTVVAGLYLWLICVHTRISSRLVRAGLLPIVFAVVLLVMSIAALAELRINSSSWYHPDPRVVSHPNPFAWDEWHFQGLPQGDFVRRAWKLPKGVQDLEVGLEVRASQPVSDQWGASASNYRFDTLQEAGESFTQVQTPLGTDPFLAWSFDTGGVLSGRSFRVSLEMRAPRPILASGCRGVWLQEDGGSYAAKCQSVDLDSTWKPIQLQWTAPMSSQSPNRIRIVLNDFDGLSYDVRRVQLEERVGANWTPLSSLWLNIGVSGKSSRLWLNPTDVWQSVKLGLKVTPSGTESTLEAVLWVGSAALEVRKVQALGSARVLEPVPSVGRVALWFTQPNLLGHSVAALLLCGLALSRRGWLSLLLAVTGLGLIALTGSRTALLVVVVGIPLLAAQNLSPRARPIALSVMVAVAVLALVLTPGIRRDGLSFLNDGNATPRTRIMQIAWQAVLEHPFGLGQGKFAEYFEQHVGTAPHDAIQHAHNFWLELAARFGFPGLIAAVWISLGLLFVGWKRAQWRGMTLVILLLLLNLTDNTLLYQGVFCPVILTLNALFEIKDLRLEQV
jgi:O-antigen ligase